MNSKKIKLSHIAFTAKGNKKRKTKKSLIYYASLSQLIL